MNLANLRNVNLSLLIPGLVAALGDSAFIDEALGWRFRVQRIINDLNVVSDRLLGRLVSLFLIAILVLQAGVLLVEV